MSEELVIYEKIGTVARIWLNRPQAINALSKELIQAVKDAVDRLNKDKDVRVGIIAGKGDRGFCAGFDLNASATGVDVEDNASSFELNIPDDTSADILVTRLKRIQFENELYMKIWDCSKPIIGALHGHVVGGGLFIALSCDMLVAADNTKLSNAEVSYGLNYTEIFPMGCYKLPQNIMRELALTGPSTVKPDLLKQIGFYNRVVPYNELETESLKLAMEVSHLSPMSAMMSKKSLNTAYELMNMKGTMHFAESMFALNRLNGETSEAVEFWETARNKSFKDAILEERKKQEEADKPVLDYIASLH